MKPDVLHKIETPVITITALT